MKWETAIVLASGTALLAWLLTNSYGFIVGAFVPPAVVIAAYWCGLNEGVAILQRRKAA